MTEWTCKCIKSFIVQGKFFAEPDFEFIEGHEYQVDIYPLYFKVYANGDWDDYEHFNRDEFDKYFKLIEF